MTTPKVGRFTNISHHSFSPFSICIHVVKQIVNNSVLTQAVPRINLLKISHSQVNIFVIFITFLFGEFQC